MWNPGRAPALSETVILWEDPSFPVNEAPAFDSISESGDTDVKSFSVSSECEIETRSSLPPLQRIHQIYMYSNV